MEKIAQNLEKITNSKERIVDDKFVNYNFSQNENEINQHIQSIEYAKVKLKDDIRTQELKNWLNYLHK